MADETLGFYVEIGNNVAATIDDLNQLPTAMERMTQRVLQALEQLSSTNPFARVISESELATLSVKEIGAAAEASARFLEILGRANAGGAGIKSITDPAGIKASISDIERQNALLQEQLVLRERAARISSTPIALSADLGYQRAQAAEQVAANERAALVSQTPIARVVDQELQRRLAQEQADREAQQRAYEERLANSPIGRVGAGQTPITPYVDPEVMAEEARQAEKAAQFFERAAQEARALEYVQERLVALGIGPDEHPLDVFRNSEGKLNVAQAEAAAATLRSGAATARAISLGVPEDADPIKLAGANASAISAAVAEERKTAALEAQGKLTGQLSELQAQVVDLDAREAQALIRVLRVQEQIRAANEAGVTDQAKILSLAGQEIAAFENLRSVQAKIAADAEKAAAADAKAAAEAAAAGGGFFGGFRKGFIGNEDEGLNDFGQQAGFIAKYALLYQTFRYVEDAIRGSIEQTIEFDRAVSDLANQLGLSRDNAGDLANNLAEIGAQSGTAPIEAIRLGSQYAATFAGQGNPADLARQGATVGSQLSLLTGTKDASGDLRDATAVVQSFNLSVGDTYRVLDAATSAAQHFGLANAAAVLPGLAQIGDLAQQAGFSVEYMANAIADISARTGESSDAAAGELRRFLGREGNTAFQQVFAQEGINTTQPFQDELSQLSAKFKDLSDQEKGFITGQFGGGRAGAAALVLLEDYNRIQDKTNESLHQGGIFQQQYFQRLSDVRGLISQLRAEFDLLFKDIGQTGIGAGFGLLLETLKPILTTTDDLLQLFNKIPAPIREAAFAAAELAAAAKVISALSLGSLLGRLGGSKGSAASGTGIAEAEGQLALNIETGSEKVEAAAITGGTTIREALAFFTAQLEAGAVAIEEGSVLGALGAGASKAGSFLKGLGPGGLAIGALLGAAVVDQVAHSTSGILSAADRANSDSVHGFTIDELRNQADKFRNDAEAARHSSSGIVGSTVNFLLGDPTGKASAAAEAQAKLADEDAKLTEKALNAAGAQNQLGASMVDLSNTANAASTSVKNLTEAGFTAQGVVNAIIQKFKDLDFESKARAQGQFGIPKGDAGLVATTAGQQATATLQKDSENPNVTLAGGPQLGPNTLADVQGVVQGAVHSYLKSIGLTNATSGQLTVPQLEAEKKAVLAALIANAKKHGDDIKDIAKILPELKLAASIAVDGQFQQIAGLNGTKLSESQINQYLQSLQTEVAAVVSQYSNAADLRNAPQGGAVIGNEKALDDLKRFAQTIQDDSDLTTKQKIVALRQIKVAEQAQQLAIDQAKANLISVQGALAASEISPFDQLKIDETQLASLEKQLKVTKGVEARDQIKTQINQLEYQIAQQQEQNFNARFEAKTPSDDAVGQALDAVAAAKNQLILLQREGVKSGADYYNAIKAVNDAEAAALLAKAQEANAIASANVDPRNKLEVARVQLENDLRTLAATNKYGQDGLETPAHAQARQQVRADRQSIIQNQVDIANAASTASADPGDSLAQADAQLRNAIRSLRHDLRGTQQYYQDLAALKAAQLAVAQAGVDRQNAALGASTSPGDSTGEASAQLQEALNQLRIDKVGTTKYYQDLKAVHDAQYALAQANVQLFSDQQTARASAYAASIDPSDAIASAEAQIQAANAQIQSARNALSKDKSGTDQYYKDLASLNQGVAQLHQAEAGLAQAISQAASVATLLGSDITDPVAQAQAAVVAAQTKLQEDRKRGGDVVTIQADELALQQATWGKQKTIFDQQLNLEQEKYQNYEITAAQYLQFLQGQKVALTAQLAGMKAGTAGYFQIQQELEQVNTDIISANNSASGQFNLGNINLPTVYQVRRALAGGLTHILSQSIAGLSPTDAGSSFGLSQSTAASAMQALVTDPLQAAISSIDASSAVNQLQLLQSTIASITSGGSGGASSAAGAGGGEITGVQPVFSVNSTAAVSRVVNAMFAVQRTGIVPKKVR